MTQGKVLLWLQEQYSSDTANEGDDFINSLTSLDEREDQYRSIQTEHSYFTQRYMSCEFIYIVIVKDGFYFDFFLFDLNLLVLY